MVLRVSDCSDSLKKLAVLMRGYAALTNGLVTTDGLGSNFILEMPGTDWPPINLDDGLQDKASSYSWTLIKEHIG